MASPIGEGYETVAPVSDRALAVAAIAVLLFSTAVVWDVGGYRERTATEAKTADAVGAQVTARQAAADYDGDGIPDARDACPTRPETQNGFQDGDGCPDVVATTGAS
ncbi:MAG: thrombospondin type 3 repeat-containing protein [Haloarculaceae archaeon]